jgi:hypothetical protein
MKPSLLLALAAVFAVAAAPAFAVRLGGVHRSLLQDNSTGECALTELQQSRPLVELATRPDT